MLKTRVIPCLLLSDESLVKTIKFKNASYIGDPINTVWIYNDMEVDELIVLDIDASKNNKDPNFELISNIASECFMPLSYGGGVNSIDDMRTIFSVGVEKIIINSYTFHNQDFISNASKIFGSQSIIGAIDVKQNTAGNYEIFSMSGSKNMKLDPVSWSIELEQQGVGELFVNSIDRDGTWEGYDIELLRSISSEVSIPVIACGGAGKLNHFHDAVRDGGVAALAAGSMFVYQKKGLGVLIRYPSRKKLEILFNGTIRVE